ncbi:MAG TPA: transglycosylase family protein [Solirubrobacteraceae bacterium]|nr:transglycosylase family protein [Solirubrobacteraceae bacterium]
MALTPGLAAAKPPSPAHVRAYEHAYEQVAKRLGTRVPGRNIVRDGVAAHRAATDAETVASLQVLQRMLAAGAATSSTPTPALGSMSSAGASGVPACASESGTNYSTGAANTNASSGATGRYQILPSTAAAYGCSLATAAGQDACAQTIYAHQGAGAWVGCGG